MNLYLINLGTHGKSLPWESRNVKSVPRDSHVIDLSQVSELIRFYDIILTNKKIAVIRIVFGNFTSS